MVRGLLRVALVWTVCMTATPALAQGTTTEHAGSFWAGLMTSWYLSPEWSIWFDTHYNVRAFFVLRGGLTYNFEKGPRITGGLAHLLTDPGNGSLTRDEIRPWAQVVFPARLGPHWSFSQRIRSDMRFRQNVEDAEPTSGFAFTARWRFQSVITYWFDPVGPVQPLIQVADEVLVNLGGEVGPNFLDQNRISLLGGVKVDPVVVRLGYMDRFVPGASGVNRVHEHNAILWVSYSFRSPKAEPEVPSMPEQSNP